MEKFSIRDIQVLKFTPCHEFSRPQTKHLLCIAVHGAGLAAQSWYLLAQQLFLQGPGIHMLAVQLPGHGQVDGDPRHLTGADWDAAVESVCCSLTPDLLGLEAVPPILLLGHSAGGAVAARVAHKLQQRRAAEASEAWLPHIVGCVMLDTVEDTALQSLAGTAAALKARPHEFPSMHAACEWQYVQATPRAAYPGLLLGRPHTHASAALPSTTALHMPCLAPCKLRLSVYHHV